MSKRVKCGSMKHSVPAAWMAGSEPKYPGTTWATPELGFQPRT